MNLYLISHDVVKSVQRSFLDNRFVVLTRNFRQNHRTPVYRNHIIDVDVRIPVKHPDCFPPGHWRRRVTPPTASSPPPPPEDECLKVRITEEFRTLALNVQRNSRFHCFPERSIGTCGVPCRPLVQWLSDYILISNQSIKQYNRTSRKVMTKYKGVLRRSEIKGSEGVSEGVFY